MIVNVSGTCLTVKSDDESCRHELMMSCCSDDRGKAVGSRSTSFPGDYDDNRHQTSGGDHEVPSQVIHSHITPVSPFVHCVHLCFLLYFQNNVQIYFTQKLY